jgi:hypothetical protein
LRYFRKVPSQADEGADEGERMYTYHVWGIRRSGNHAIIGWILKHVGAPFVHFNDIQDPHDPLTPGGVTVLGVPGWRYKRGLLRKVRHYLPTRNKATFAGSDPSVDYAGLAALPGLSCRVFSYEDKVVTNADELRDVPAPGETRRSVLLLRDPFNLFASLLKAGCFSRQLDELPAIYAHHAEEFLRQEQTGLVGINYNEWFQDADYRISIARKLGFDTDGAPYDDVPSNGGGSSFSGQTYRGRASRMDVFGRWRQVAEHMEFQRLVDSPQVRAAAETIFPALAEEVYCALRPSHAIEARLRTH